MATSIKNFQYWNIDISPWGPWLRAWNQDFSNYGANIVAAAHSSLLYVRDYVIRHLIIARSFLFTNFIIKRGSAWFSRSRRDETRRSSRWSARHPQILHSLQSVLRWSPTRDCCPNHHTLIWSHRSDSKNGQEILLLLSTNDTFSLVAQIYHVAESYSSLSNCKTILSPNLIVSHQVVDIIRPPPITSCSAHDLIPAQHPFQLSSKDTIPDWH